ncbi:MAG: phosphatase PAP2 family protein [Lachnospiraceae bacterium]|nr:phosphatase PAP2 family protein [Lachnospiraceae bacterium]
MANRILAVLPPRYCILPLAGAVAVHVLSYYGARKINEHRTHYCFALAVDEKIPFVPSFILIYLLSFAFWIAGYLLASYDSPRACYQITVGNIIAEAAAFLIFILLPTTMERAQINGTGIFNDLTAWFYRIDQPDNLFPSVHCLESWICFCSALTITHAPRWYRPFSLVCALLICASTVLVKQHVVVDIPAGILLAQFGFWLAGRLPWLK